MRGCSCTSASHYNFNEIYITSQCIDTDLLKKSQMSPIVKNILHICFIRVVHFCDCSIGNTSCSIRVSQFFNRIVQIASPTDRDLSLLKNYSMMPDSSRETRLYYTSSYSSRIIEICAGVPKLKLAQPEPLIF